MRLAHYYLFICLGRWIFVKSDTKIKWRVNIYSWRAGGDLAEKFVSGIVWSIIAVFS